MREAEGSGGAVSSRAGLGGCVGWACGTAPALQGPSETFDVFLVLPIPISPLSEMARAPAGVGRGCSPSLSHLSLPLKAPEEVTRGTVLAAVQMWGCTGNGDTDNVRGPKQTAPTHQLSSWMQMLCLQVQIIVHGNHHSPFAWVICVHRHGTSTSTAANLLWNAESSWGTASAPGAVSFFSLFAPPDIAVNRTVDV